MNRISHANSKEASMYHVQVMVNRLRKFCGLSYDKIVTKSRELPSGYPSLNKARLYSLVNDPNASLQPSRRKSVRRIYFNEMRNYIRETAGAEKFIVRYPRVVDAAFDIFNSTGKGNSPAASNTRQALESMARFALSRAYKRRDDERLVEARAYWLLAKIHKQNVLATKDTDAFSKLSAQGMKSITKARDYYIDARVIYEKNIARYPYQCISLAMNEFDCRAVEQFSRCGAGFDSKALSDHLQQSEILETFTPIRSILPLLIAALKVEPYQWKIARFGLSLCSVTDDPKGAASFYQRLTEASPEFKDSNYQLKNSYYFPLRSSPILHKAREEWGLF